MTDHRYHHYYWKLANRGRSKQLWQTEQEAGGACRLAGLATVINELRWSEAVAEATSCSGGCGGKQPLVVAANSM